MISTGNAKIRQRKLKSGERVYGLQIVKNFRLNGRPTSRILKYLGSVRESEIPSVSASWWIETDKAIDELVASRVLWLNCAAKIRKQLEAVIPRPARPTKTATVATISSTSNKEAIRAALAQAGFPADLI